MNDLFLLENTEDMVTTERVAIVVSRLVAGHKGTTADIAEWVGLTRFGAWDMLSRISRVLPVSIVDGCWQYANIEMLESENGDGLR